MDSPWTFTEFLVISLYRMTDHYLPKLLAAVRALKPEQLWHKESGTENSVGGIVMHMLEHVHRFSAGYPQPSGLHSKGIEDHFPDLFLSPEELAERAEERFASWAEKMESCIRLTVLHPEKVRQEADLFRIFHLVEHTGYHLGQVIDRTRKLAGTRFRFCQSGLNEKQLRERVEARLRELTASVQPTGGHLP